MNQSAYLPERAILDGLLEGLLPAAVRHVQRDRLPRTSSGERPLSASFPGSVRVNSGEPTASFQASEVSATSLRSPEETISHETGSSQKRRSVITPLEALAELSSGLLRAKSIEESFSVFSQWARTSTGAVSIFVTDKEGLGMVASSATDDYLAVAGDISTSLQKLSRLLPDIEGGSTQLELSHPKVGGVRWIEVVGCPTDAGFFTVGLLLTEQLSLGWPTCLRQGLRQAVRAMESR